MLAETAGGVILSVRVIPRARRAGLAGVRDDALLIRLVAPPVEGAANAELIEILSKQLAIPKRDITIVRGERSRVKHVRLIGVDAARVMKRIDELTN